MTHKIIAVDFDGTLCENKYPEIGEANRRLAGYLKCQQSLFGAKLILWTCRTDERLTEAVTWCHDKLGLVFDAVNDNLPEAIGEFGHNTRKIFAHEYIDDRMSTKFKLPFKRRKKNGRCKKV